MQFLWKTKFNFPPWFTVLSIETSFLLFCKSIECVEVELILQEMLEESHKLKKMIQEGTVFYITHGNFISKFFLQLLQHAISIPLCKSIIFLIFISYIACKLCKSEIYILHWMEVISILGFLVCLPHNMPRGFLYVYHVYYEDHVPLARETFGILDVLFSSIWILL